MHRGPMGTRKHAVGEVEGRLVLWGAAHLVGPSHPAGKAAGGAVGTRLIALLTTAGGGESQGIEA